MSKPIPYMRFYVADYIGDTMHLSTLEQGAYILIICSYWQKQEPPTEEKMHRVARMKPAEWQEIRDTMSELFTIKKDVWHHKRIDTELKAVRTQAKRNREAGLKSAAKRWGTKPKTDSDYNGCLTVVTDSLQRNCKQTESKRIEDVSLFNLHAEAHESIVLDDDDLKIMRENEERWQMEARLQARKASGAVQ